MKDNILSFTYKKSKQKYTLISIFIMVSVLLMNMILQTMSFTVQTLHDGILNSKNLSLILMQNSNKTDQPYPVDVSKIEQLEHVSFVTMSKFLGLNGKKEKDTEDDLLGLATYGINPKFSYYVGIDHMEDDKLYCSKHKYKDLNKDLNTYSIVDMKTKLSIIPYDFTPPMILDSCFITEYTYNKLVKELPEGQLAFVVPEYIIGVDKVQNVFKVVRQLNDMYADDNPLLIYQAKGLEGIITNTSSLLIILTIALVIFLIFNTTIITYLISSLVSDVKRDLMILYLNGLSRKAISKELFKHCKSYLMRPIIVSSTLSILIFLFVLQFILKQPIHLFWFGIIIGIDCIVILINIISLKLSIKKMVNAKTSNKNISRIIRN